MKFKHDRRGQSVVIGTVILFGFLIVALSLYQSQVVPIENNEIEFEHSQQIEGDMTELRNNILRTGSTGVSQSQRIRLGTRYPQRTLFINPPPATGEIRTTEERTLEINNAEISDAPDNAKDFWNNNPEWVDEDGPVFHTRSIQYRPNYNEFQNGPRLTYEHSVITAEFPNQRALFRTDQTVVGNDRIALTMLTGELSEDGVESRAVDLDATSQAARTVPIEVDEDTTIVLPTAVENRDDLTEGWTERLPDGVTAEELDGQEAVEISFTEESQYRLRLAEVAVDDQEDADARYIIRVGPENLPSGVDAGVEVRDKYNNPVSDEVVTFDEQERMTDDEGRVFFNTDDPGEYVASIDSIDGEPPQDYESVTFTVTTAESGGGETLPGPEVTNAAHDGDEPLEAGDTFTLTADVSSVGQTGEDNWRGGTPIQDAEWYIEGNDPGEGNANSMNTNDGEYLSNVEVSVEDDVSADDLEEGENTIIIRGQDSRGVWGEDTDSVDIEVEEGEETDPDPDPDPTFERVEATVTEQRTGGNPGIEQIEFDWELSDSTDIELRIYDDDGNEVGSEVVTSAPIDGEQLVDVTAGSGPASASEPRPVTVEATITDTGETCSGTIEEGDGEGPFEICE